MSAPRTKRQYADAGSDPSQRQITSFFTKSSSTSSSGHCHAAPTVIPPPPPAQVQASLISVGMRVRKSVPEGYKTGQLYSGFSLWSDTTSSFSDPTATQQNPYTARTGGGGGELAPFCGINKIGGLSTQPSSSVPDLDDLPGLTSSQDSIVSEMDSGRPFNHRKRMYSVDETAEEVDAPSPFENGHWVDRNEWVDGECSPRSLNPVGWENARVMAVPKGRRKGLVNGQENVMFDVGGAGPRPVDDFEEAPFLAMEVEFES